MFGEYMNKAKVLLEMKSDEQETHRSDVHRLRTRKQQISVEKMNFVCVADRNLKSKFTFPF